MEKLAILRGKPLLSRFPDRRWPQLLPSDLASPGEFSQSIELSLTGPAGDVVDRRLVEAQPDDDGPIERRFGLAVAAAVEPVRGVGPCCSC